MSKTAAKKVRTGVGIGGVRRPRKLHDTTSNHFETKKILKILAKQGINAFSVCQGFEQIVRKSADVDDVNELRQRFDKTKIADTS